MCPVVSMGTPFFTDTLRNYDMEEAVVVASPKETTYFRKQPVSVSLFDRRALELIGAEDVKGTSVFSPNFYMPDYGSRITSAVYIRGVGSRINTPAVGLYVDNIPVVEKSAYDFSFLDVNRVDILRGPQGTLYGRNSMGGLVRVFTADPLLHRGTDVSLGLSGRTTGRHVHAVTYLHPIEDCLALSVGGYYEGENGYYRNVTTGEKADWSEAGGGRMRMTWKPSERFRLNLTAAYEYSDEAACPYYLVRPSADIYAADSGHIAQNRSSRYRREMLTSGVDVEWRNSRFVLSSITSWQYLRDRFFMDQDFISADIFSLTQKQRNAVWTEEVCLKSLPGKKWQWTTGAFFMGQDMTTSCPVVFHGDGVNYLNRQLATVLPSQPVMSLRFVVPELAFDSRFSTPVINAAAFHQSSLDLGHGLSATVGMRADYTHIKLRLFSGASAATTCQYSMPAFRIDHSFDADPSVNGTISDGNWQVIPKVALQYNHRSGRGNVYLAVSKGYRSGGYNIQSYSELSQQQLRRNLMNEIKDYSVNTIQNIPYLPDETKQKAIAGLTQSIGKNIPDEPVAEDLEYKPEQLWNFELGGHLFFADRKVRADYTLFCMLTKDQQLARFADSGMGRKMVNAGRSRSCGGELSLTACLLNDRLTLTSAYGYTHAVFTRYDDNPASLSSGVSGQKSYKGNRVPFAPAHTLGVTAAYRQPLSGRVFRGIRLSTDLSGAGDIWWDEANTFRQHFGMRWGMCVDVEMAKDVTLSLWGRNLTDNRVSTFSFESMGNRFAQYADPITFGFDARFHF